MQLGQVVQVVEAPLAKWQNRRRRCSGGGNMAVLALQLLLALVATAETALMALGVLQLATSGGVYLL